MSDFAVTTVKRCITVELDLTDVGAPIDGIHFVPDGGDGYTITAAEARDIAAALNAVADESEGWQAQ